MAKLDKIIEDLEDALFRAGQWSQDNDDAYLENIRELQDALDKLKEQTDKAK